MSRSRLITALDVKSPAEMKTLVDTLGESVSFYKVGMELFYSAGTLPLDYLKTHKKHVFLDLKLHDIPNTVAQAVAALTRLGADLISVHTQGGREMMQAAARSAAITAAELGIERPRLVGITALTSFSETGWEEIGGTVPIVTHVEKLALLAQAAGLDGVVCSPQEAARLRALLGPDFLLVTPGIRPAFASLDDQERIMTPKDALAAGSSYLVIGRPITKADDPKAAAQAIIAEMEESK